MKPYYEDTVSGITIYHGDCREVLPELRLKVGLVLTDPPYAIGAGRGEWSATAAVAIGLHEAARCVAKGGAMLVFTTTSGRGIEFTQGAVGKNLPFNRLLTWHKLGGRSRAISPWRWDTVAVMAFGHAPLRMVGESSVFVTTGTTAKTEHPAELPSGLSEWLYAPFDSPGMVTLDPFAGTGRLLESPSSKGHRVIGVEIEERYCEIAAKRLAQGADPVEVAA